MATTAQRPNLTERVRAGTTKARAACQAVTDILAASRREEEEREAARRAAPPQPDIYQQLAAATADLGQWVGLADQALGLAERGVEVLERQAASVPLALPAHIRGNLSASFPFLFFCHVLLGNRVALGEATFAAGLGVTLKTGPGAKARHLRDSRHNRTS